LVTSTASAPIFAQEAPSLERANGALQATHFVEVQILQLASMSVHFLQISLLANFPVELETKDIPAAHFSQPL
jgi:hypothetical protein